MKVIRNFLSKDKFKYLKNIVEDPRFPYYYQKNLLPVKSKKWDKYDFFFCHMLFRDGLQVSGNKLVESVLYPITEKLGAKKIHRAKVNLYTNQHKHSESGYHVDTDYNYIKVALFSVGTNNGWTEFESGKKFLSKENSIVLFDSNKKHKAVTQTDTKIRINININYE
mgnify:FL=1